MYSQEETISSEGFFQSNVEVCVVEEETNYGQQLNGVTLNDGIYEVEAASVRADELVGLAESYSPDVLILLEQSKEELDETIQKEIDLWQAEGGILITFSGNKTFAESQRSAFKEAPVEFLKNILDEETTSRLLVKRNTNYQKYYTISDLLENTKIRNRPNTVLYGGLILVYLVLAGPGLYFFLKKTEKRQYLWGAICACSAVFVMLISLFGQSTRLKAPVLTYVREIWQYDTYQKDYINFCAQAPYNASYELYLDPSYDLVTYNRMDYMSNSTAQPETEDAEYEKTEISFGEQKNRAEISNQAAFALNEFGMQRMETLDEGEGLKGTFHFWDQKISGTVENKTGYDLESCVIAVPGYCALIGDIKNGETITLDGTEAGSVRDFGAWSAAGDLPEMEKNYLDGVIYNHMPNRSDNCLFFGKLAGNDDTFQLDSGYEAYGISYYYQEVSVDMKEDGVVYCPYAQEYSGWDGGTTVSFEMGPNSGGISEEETEVTYYLNGVFENNNIWRLYGMYAKDVMQPDSEGIYDPAFWPYAMTALEDKIRAAETGGGGKRGTILSLAFEKARTDDGTKIRNFNGIIELYNFQTGTYDEISDWEIDFASDPALEAQYVNADNQIRVRYRLSEEEKGEELRIISGLLKSDGGDLWLDGVRTTKNILKQKSLIGFVPDFFGVYENLSVIEYLEFFATSYGIYGRAGTVRAREVLEMVELSGKEEQMVDSLSRGMQQRLCLARAMIHKPKLLVLDEPNSGLDPRSRKDFQLLLQRLAREDYTILISSHILSELADLCTSIGVINGGVMVQQGKLENIMLAIDSSNPLRITVLNQVPKALELLRQDPQVSRLSVDENKIAAWFSGSREEEAYLLQKLVDAGILVVSFAREHNSLESLFFHLTGETEQKSRNTETFGNMIR